MAYSAHTARHGDALAFGRQQGKLATLGIGALHDPAANRDLLGAMLDLSATGVHPVNGGVEADNHRAHVLAMAWTPSFDSAIMVVQLPIVPTQHWRTP